MHALRPTDAKQLVTKSGYPNPTVHLLIANTTDNLRLAQYLQAEEAAVGINLVIDATDNATALARAAAGELRRLLLGQTTGSTDPNANFYSLVQRRGEELQRLLEPAARLRARERLKATDLKARETNYRVAQQIILTDRPVIVLIHQTTYAAYSTSVEGVALPAGSLNLHVENAQLK